MSQKPKATRRNIGLAALAATSLTAGIVAVPQSNAQEAKTTDMTVIMGCNVQIKQGDVPRLFRGLIAGAEGVYNGGTDKYSMIRFSPKVTAPTEAEQGKPFDYVIELGKVGAPDQIAVASVQSADQFNVWIDLPKNATLNEVALTGGDSNVTYQHDAQNNRIRFFKEGGADVSKWTEAGENQWVHGGLTAKRDGNLFVVDFPKVTLKMTPTGAPGETVAPSLDETDPKAFSPKAFAQLYANANAVGVNANAFVRCGLGEKDSTKDNGQANATSDRFPEVKIKAAEAKKTEADENNPTAKAPVTITEGDKLPDAKAQLNNVPANATAAWATTHDKLGDNQQGAITVTYADGSKDEVQIAVNVKRKPTQAEQYDPKAIQTPKPIYYQDEKLPAAKDSVVNPDALPAGTTFEWKYPANKIGENLTGTVVITYPDGSKDEVTRPVAVRAPRTMADKNDPKPITEPRMKYTLGDPDPDPRERIQDFDKLPAGTTAAWTSARGKVGPNLTGIITVTYPDGSTDEVRLPVDVSAPYTPQAKGNPTVVNVNDTIADDSAKEQIANAGQAPEGTTFTWKTKPATTAAGDVTGVVTVKVPNKDAVDVDVNYTVVAADDTTWRPQVTGDVQTVEKGTEPTDDDAKALVTNLDEAPADAKVTWKTKPDTSKAGATTGVITITVGEGENAKSVDRTVRYNVTETFAPKAKEGLTIEVGTEASDDAAAAIANVPSAPYGTKYEWVTKPDTSKVGKTMAQVKVSIPGENDQFVDVPVDVEYDVTSDFEPKKNDTPSDVVYGTDTTNWGANEAASQIQNGIEAPEGTTYEWVTKPDTTKEGLQAGEIKVTVPGHTAAETKTFNVPVEVNVGKKPEEFKPFEPKAADGLEALQGHLVKEIHAYESIANKNEAPEGTTFTWKEKPDTQTPGEGKTGTVIVKAPGQDPVEVDITYTIKPREVENQRPTDPEQPGQPTAKSVVVKPLGVEPGDQVTVNVNGTEQTYTVDAEGKIVITEGLPTDGKPFDVSVVKVGDDKGSSVVPTKWKVNLEKGTAVPVGAVVGSIIAVAAVALSFIPIPGLKDAITNIQKQMGIFNPALAGQVEKAQPVIGSLAGFAILAAILVPVIKAIVKVEDTK